PYGVTWSTSVRTDRPAASKTSSTVGPSWGVSKRMVTAPRAGLGTVARMPKPAPDLGGGSPTVPPQAHVFAHTRTTVGTSSQMKKQSKQHWTPTGVVSLALIAMKPCHPGGRDAGAGVSWSSSSSVAVKPGQSPAMAHEKFVVGVQPVTTWTYESPRPGATRTSPPCQCDWAGAPSSLHTASTLPIHAAGGQGSPGPGPPPGRMSGALGGS